MTSPAAIDDLDSPDDARVAAAIEALERGLRKADAETRARAAERLVPLARHASSDVRRAVASAAVYFPDAALDEVARVLGGDVHAYVESALRLTLDIRAKAGRERDHRDEEERELAELLATIQKKSSASVRRLAERAIALSKARTVRQITHEVVQIVGPAKVAHADIDKALRGPARSDAATIAAANGVARDQLDLVLAFLDDQRHASSAMFPDYETEHLAELVAHAAKGLRTNLAERRARLAFENAVPHELVAEVCRPQLLLALQNVLKNASEAYPLDGDSPIVIRARATLEKQRSVVVLAIEDHGAGFSDEAKRQLFVPLASIKPGGSGFGMRVVRRAIEEVHHGKLSIADTPGGGATIEMRFPARQSTRGKAGA